MPERWETCPASPEDVNDVLEEIGTDKDAEDVIIEMNLLLSCDIQGVNCAENQACQEYQLQEMMDNNPEYWTMHQSSVKIFQWTLICVWFLFKENIIFPKDYIAEDNKRIGEEYQDGEDNVVKFPVEV